MQFGLLCLEAAVPLLTHVELVPRTAVGVGRARSLLQPCLTFGGCWVPGRSPAAVTEVGQFTAVYLGQAVMFVLCFYGKCVPLLSEIFRHCL